MINNKPLQFHNPHHAMHPLPGQVRPCARHLSSSGKACCWLPVPCRWNGIGIKFIDLLLLTRPTLVLCRFSASRSSKLLCVGGVLGASSPFKLFRTKGQTANFATIVSCNFKGGSLGLQEDLHNIIDKHSCDEVHTRQQQRNAKQQRETTIKHRECTQRRHREKARIECTHRARAQRLHTEND